MVLLPSSDGALALVRALLLAAARLEVLRGLVVVWLPVGRVSLLGLLGPAEGVGVGRLLVTVFPLTSLVLFLCDDTLRCSVGAVLASGVAALAGLLDVVAVPAAEVYLVVGWTTLSGMS